jgi:hypothetical protein
MVQKELENFLWKEFLKWYDGRRENEITSKRIFEVEVFFPHKILTSPLFEETLRVFFFAPSLEDSGVLIIFEEKMTSSKISFQMTT